MARRVVDPLNGAVGLEILAWIAAEKHDAPRAAALLGAAPADAQRQRQYSGTAGART
ncbi:hypothetical protein ACFXG4_48125 [Nocardia sp. NPDC059246]|uniref:hypothetical protein n=1 Tax=unclassified Nocardia TaxID=2637762 RepID=UPI00367CB25E